MSFWSDVTTYVKDVTGIGVIESATSAGGDLTQVEGIFGTFFADITNPYMWRSFAWLILGLVLFGFGLLLLLRKPIEEAVGTAAKAVAL